MPRPPRILLVSPKPPPQHGAARAVEVLLAGCGERVEWRHVDARYAGEVSELQKFKLGKFVALFRYLAQTTFGCLRCDGVVLTPSFQAGTFLKDSLFIWLCWLLRMKPMVAWYHMRFGTMRYAERSAPMRWFVRATLRRVSFHICVADRLTGELPDFIPTSSRSALPNGVPAYPRAEGHGRSDRVRIVYLSHMGAAKGWRVLFAAAERLCAENSSVDFEFYGPPGPGDDAEKLAEAFRETRYAAQIRYQGFADDAAKTELFRTSDALCFPSLNEAFPITILEAMSAGLPVVASDVGGIADAVTDGEGGLLVPPGDVDALCTALEQVIADPACRLRWGTYNRDRYEQLFTDEAFCERWCDFLIEATTQR